MPLFPFCRGRFLNLRKKTYDNADFAPSRVHSREEDDEVQFHVDHSTYSDRKVCFPKDNLWDEDTTLDDVEGSGVGNDAECRTPTCKSHDASSTAESIEKDQIQVIEQVSPHSFSEKNEFDYDKELLLVPTFSGFHHNEDTPGDKETNEFGNIVAEPGNGDDTSDASEILKDLVSRGESKDQSINVLQQQSDSSLKPLDLAEEIENKQVFTGLHYEEGAAAQPMRLECVERGSTVLGYFDVRYDNAITQTISSQPFRQDYGSSQVFAVHLNYIAVGMSKGSIFIVPIKYTAHHVDNMDIKMMPLGLQGDRSYVPVTSMRFNQKGDILFAGYGDGHYTVWDVQKASALKVITEHKAPVFHMLYLGQDTQVTRQFNVVSGDSWGVVKLIRFSVVPWLNRITYTKSMMKLLAE